MTKGQLSLMQQVLNDTEPVLILSDFGRAKEKNDTAIIWMGLKVKNLRTNTPLNRKIDRFVIQLEVKNNKIIRFKNINKSIAERLMWETMMKIFGEAKFIYIKKTGEEVMKKIDQNMKGIIIQFDTQEFDAA